jgi:hypothetical protein
MKTWRELIHRMKHCLQRHNGVVVSIQVNSEEVWIGFQCLDCGDITSLCKPLSWSYREEMDRRRRRTCFGMCRCPKCGGPAHWSQHQQVHACADPACAMAFIEHQR